MVERIRLVSINDLIVVVFHIIENTPMETTEVEQVEEEESVEESVEVPEEETITEEESKEVDGW